MTITIFDSQIFVDTEAQAHNSRFDARPACFVYFLSLAYRPGANRQNVIRKPMTTEGQLRKYIQQPDRIQDIVNYIICVLALFGGLLLLFITFQIIAIRPKNDLDIYAGTLLSVIGFYGIWRIPKSYSIIKINSKMPSEQKRQLIENYIKTLNVRQRFVSGNLFRIVYEDKFWNSIILSIGYDQNQILINAHSKGGAVASGFIDFGLTKKATNKAKEYFNEKARL